MIAPSGAISYPGPNHPASGGTSWSSARRVGKIRRPGWSLHVGESRLSAANRRQSCPSCGAELDVSGVPVGTWLACPGCDQPIQVAARRVERPPPPKEPEPPSSAWLADPRLDAPTASPPAAKSVTESTPPLPPWSPDFAAGGNPASAVIPDAPPARPKRLWGMTLRLSGLCALAQVIFTGNVLQAGIRPQDFALAALFGAALGAFVSQLAFSIRLEDDARSRGGSG